MLRRYWWFWVGLLLIASGTWGIVVANRGPQYCFGAGSGTSEVAVGDLGDLDSVYARCDEAMQAVVRDWWIGVGGIVLGLLVITYGLGYGHGRRGQRLGAVVGTPSSD
jgi:hypothetical protein